jgi:hypothetical protein
MIELGTEVIDTIKTLEDFYKHLEAFYKNVDSTTHNKDCAVTQSEIASPKPDKSGFAQS